MSADGRYITFQSVQTTGPNFEWFQEIYVYDRVTGAARTVISANNHSANPSISADGRYLAFLSSATNLALGGGNQDIYLTRL